MLLNVHSHFIQTPEKFFPVNCFHKNCLTHKLHFPASSKPNPVIDIHCLTKIFKDEVIAVLGVDSRWPWPAWPSEGIRFDWIGTGDLCIKLRLPCDPVFCREIQ